MEKKNSPRETHGDKPKLQITALGRKAWVIFLSLLLVLALVSTFAAFFQPPDRNPTEHPAFPSLDWFMQPIEQNAELRLPAISSHLNDVFVVPDTDHVWAVGDTGMILHSYDAGITRERVPKAQPEKAAGFIPGDRKSRAWGDFDIQLPDLTRKAYAAEAPKETTPNIKISPRDTATKNQPPLKNQIAPEPNTNIKQSAPPSIQQQSSVDPGRQAAAGQIFVEPYYRQRPVDFYAVQFVDEKRGWAVGSEGAIVFTQDGGENWAIIELNYKGALYSETCNRFFGRMAAQRRAAQEVY